ncbi:unnamed protein product [Diamesa serratosioi]
MYFKKVLLIFVIVVIYVEARVMANPVSFQVKETYEDPSAKDVDKKTNVATDDRALDLAVGLNWLRTVQPFDKNTNLTIDDKASDPAFGLNWLRILKEFIEKLKIQKLLQVKKLCSIITCAGTHSS